MSKSNTNCCVYSCKSVRRKNPDLMFHRFPRKHEQILVEDHFGETKIMRKRTVWENQLKMGKKATDFMTVCSLHFTSGDYTCSGWSSQKQLMKTAIPTQNLPKKTYDLTEEKLHNNESRKAQRYQRLWKRRTKIERSTSSTVDNQKSFITADATESPTMTENVSYNIEDTNLVAAKSQLLSKSVCTCECHNLYQKKEFGVQVETLKNLVNQEIQVNTSDNVTINDFVQNDSQLNSLTGIHSFVFFNTLVSLLSLTLKDKRIHRLSVHKRLLLFFMKMKLDLPYVVLSILFGISSQSCRNIFVNIATALSPLLKSTIHFPSTQEILQNLPQCFKEFKNVRIILDCTEIPIQRHKRLCCRIKTYSNYKGTQTVKFMTGVSPGGLITHVSPAYGGRVSDRAIFEQSNLLDKLNMYEDAVMVDKGFFIENLCEQFGIKLIRPPFLHQKKQFSHSEAVQNAKIAAARVHIERTNQRIKIFKIFKNHLPVTLIPIVDDLFIIACGIVNLSNSILADDKFIYN